MLQSNDKCNNETKHIFSIFQKPKYYFVYFIAITNKQLNHQQSQVAAVIFLYPSHSESHYLLHRIQAYTF